MDTDKLQKALDIIQDEMDKNVETMDALIFADLEECANLLDNLIETKIKRREKIAEMKKCRERAEQLEKELDSGVYNDLDGKSWRDE